MALMEWAGTRSCGRRWRFRVAFHFFSVRLLLAADCGIVRVDSGLWSTKGTYNAFGTKNRRLTYRGPGGAILQYEVAGHDDEWGATSWLKGSGWYLTQAGEYRYGLVTEKTTSELAGLSAWQMRAGSPASMDVTCTTCSDTPNWASGVDCWGGHGKAEDGCVLEGWTCEAYLAKGWCINGAPSPSEVSPDRFGSQNNFPERYCCACGGKWAPTLQEARDELTRSQVLVANLEAAVREMSNKLVAAEKTLVSAAANVTEVQKLLPAARKVVLLNADALENVSRHDGAEFSDAQILQEQFGALRNAAWVLANSTAVKANTSQALVNDTRINQLELMNRQIWAVTDPENKVSVESAETRMKALEMDAVDFQDRLDEEAEIVLSKRFRSNVDRLHRGMEELAEVAGAAQGETGDDRSHDPDDPYDQFDPDEVGTQLGLRALSPSRLRGALSIDSPCARRSSSYPLRRRVECGEHC